ncbi:MAG: beta-lactamase family protein [Sphingobacteriia bacterium]|nr:beta-lactamase family protein [Sphingobacteriia bacterium]
MQRLLIIVLNVFLFSSCHSQDSNHSQPASVTKPFFRPLTETEKNNYANAIEPFYDKLLRRSGFNGAILVAKNGEVVFEDYRGFVNLKTKEPITAESSFHLASVSKTFTGMTILKLIEQGRLGLQDDVRKYLPDFPYQNITIKLLLTHRSGLPNYLNFVDNSRVEYYQVKTKKGKTVTRKRVVKVKSDITRLLTNETLYQYLVNKRPPIQSQPDRLFNYCNTNYALLAYIIEKITKQSFPEYMKDSVFVPLGMNHTYIFSIKDSAAYQPTYRGNSPWPMDKLDCVYGDKNVYSTVRDMLLWDKALYQNKFVSANTFNMAIQPFTYERRAGHYYGLGWHLLNTPPDPIIPYHNGKWHGTNSVFKRIISDSATIIVIGNKLNNNIYKTGQLSMIFTGKADTTKPEE